MSWADRVASKGANVKLLLALHVDRWKEWEKYVDVLKDAGFEERMPPVSREWDKIETKALEDTEKPKLNDGGESQLQLAFVRKLRKKKAEGKKFKQAWAKRMLQRGEDYVLLDAGFGSVNTTSDLDVNVVSTTDEVVTLWLEFIRVRGYAFCEHWDSNFYYQPGVWNDQDVEPWTKVLLESGFKWTTDATALYELKCVKAYCDAYESGRYITVDGRRSIPRPDQMDASREQECYSNALYFGEKFRQACEAYMKGGSADQVRYAYLKYAVTKMEGLVSVTSLAVCKVFGPDVYEDYKMKKGLASGMREYVPGIAAYEMLRNLRMHASDEGYRSKYANRIVLSLFNASGMCFVHSKRFREVTKTNRAPLAAIADALGYLLDYMDDKGDYVVCPFEPRKSVWLGNLSDTLDILCDRAYDYVDGLIKESTSNKSKGVKYVDDLVK